MNGASRIAATLTLAMALAFSGCAKAPDVEQLMAALSEAGMKAEMDPAPFPRGINPADLQTVAKMSGARMEHLVVDGAKVMVLRFKNEDAAKKYETHWNNKRASEPKPAVPQFKPTRAEGRVKNFVFTLSPGSGEDEAALQAKLAQIEKAVASL